MFSRASISPPIPNVISSGASFFNSRTTCAAWRSPEASPATIASFMVGLFPPWSDRRLACRPGGQARRLSLHEGLESHRSSQWKRIHRPADGNSAEEQRDEDPE